MTRGWLAAIVSVMAFVPFGFAAAPPSECAVPADLTQVDVKLRHLAVRLRAGTPVVIVAVGGASTKGSAAGSPDLAYPRRLEEALSRGYPTSPITVINRGVPRQTAEQMLKRFPRDVIAENPTLVIWETGISDAVRGVEIGDFANALQTGIDDLKRRMIDVILMDMQFSRATAAVIDFERYLNTLHRIGEMNGVYVFPRFAMMRYWSRQNVFDFDEVAKGERARLAARVYQCIGRQLAEAIRLAAR
jgi:acyl-CoA thioesterase I